jgi:hypothetical protein
LRPGKRRQKIAFQCINNLIIVPLEINGVSGNFILDTGIKGNILFLAEEKKLKVKDALRSVSIRGFGYGDPIKALVSTGNKISYKNIKFENIDFYLLEDEKLNFSAKTGVTINGVIGADFFRNNIVKIDYSSKKVTVYDSEYFYKRKHKKNKVDSVSLVFHNDKPYLEGSVKLFEKDTSNTPVKLLIDTGGTDALWLFKDVNKFERLPPKYFTDFLGESLTGSLHGDKSRIENFSFGGYDFGNPVVSFLDDTVAKSAKKIRGRSGTLGAGILKRFTVWFDYKNHKMFLKKNSNFKKEFYYNMSGLEINYNGKVMVLQFIQSTSGFIKSDNSKVLFNYNFVLKPSYVIANVRKGSPGDLEGLKAGDILMEIDHISVQEKTYGDIVEHFYTKKNKVVVLLIMRSEVEMLFKFQLIDELE